MLLTSLIRGVVWAVYGPYSGVVPVFLLYGIIEFVIECSATTDSRDRMLYIAVVISCALGITMWLLRGHLNPLLLLLLGAFIIFSFVALIRSVRGTGKRRRRRGAPQRRGADEEAARHHASDAVQR